MQQLIHVFDLIHAQIHLCVFSMNCQVTELFDPFMLHHPSNMSHINNIQIMSPTQRFLFAVVRRPHTVSCL